MLRESPLDARAATVRYPPGYALGAGGYHSSAVGLLVLEGRLEAGPRTLGKGVYARVPAGALIPEVGSPSGALVLQFWSGAPDFVASKTRTGTTGEPLVVDSEQVPWTPSTVTQPGRPPIPLLIRRLYTDAETGARTWLVAILRGVKVPWEVHSSPEEGFLVEGDYVQPECLPEGETRSAYVPGGYFWRPARLWHSGPGESTKAYAIWLLRTPRALDVEFGDACSPHGK